MATTVKEVNVGDFSGGLNTRDSASELQKNEFSDSMNVTLDERGATQKRLGYTRRHTAFGSGLVSNTFYWKSKGWLISQIGTGTHKDNGASFKTWTTSARIGMCEYLGNLIMIHPVDGVYTYDGTTVTLITAGVTGDSCASWQNRLWTNNATNVDRVNFSDIGATTGLATNFNRILEKDASRVVCLAGASGLDISGRPGLLVFKADSAYRIYDSATGAYNTIDASIGCASNIGAVSLYGNTYVIHPRGIFYTNGINPMTEVTQKIENFFHRDHINQSRPDLFCAGKAEDRLWFSFPTAGATANNLSLEYHPLGKWIVPHTLAASSFASVGNTSADMVFGSPSVNGVLFNSHSGGADDGAAIASYFQTRWFEPNYGNQVRVRRARFVGSGTFSASLFRDYELGQSLESLSVVIESPDVGIYDTDTYDGGSVYGPTVFQGFSDHYSVGVVRSMSIRVEETSSLTSQGRPILGQSANTIGAWTLGHISLLTIDLGNR